MLRPGTDLSTQSRGERKTFPVPLFSSRALQIVSLLLPIAVPNGKCVAFISAEAETDHSEGELKPGTDPDH